MGLTALTVLALAACDSVPQEHQSVDQRSRSAMLASEASVPSWKQTGRLSLGRMLHAATSLVDGRVLVAGGYNRTSELYDPAAGTWARTGDALASRRYHTMTPLPDGRVLMAGGEGCTPQSSAEVYDPTTGRWGATGGLVTCRSRHAAVVLPSGKVLVVGGQTSAGGMLASAEVYDPATGSWSSTGSLGTARGEFSATPLKDGRVLVVGGRGSTGNALASAEVYDPATGTWTSVGNMSLGRRYHSATLLKDGRVLVAGSGDGATAAAASVEVYDPATGTWSATGAMGKPRRYHTATLLPSGQVLVAGGYHEATGIAYSAEVYDPTAGTWSDTASMNVDRYGHTATALTGGTVLVVGGVSNHDAASAELYLSGTPPIREPVPTPLVDTHFTPLSEATEFIYSGPNAIQLGVKPGTIEARRATVLRGLVKTREGTALSGVTVSIVDHPEYGHTLTRPDGMFDLVVNGGGPVTVQYEKEGLLPSQRQVQAPWEDFAWLPEVVLIPLDSQVTPIFLDGRAGAQVAQASEVTDENGTRRATVLFPPGTQATLVLPNGGTRALDTLHLRATEYTVGSNGPQAMPGELPASSAYTYAVEMTVDEALAAGAREVRFNQPVFFYVDNFLGFPVGGIVPLGWYDKQAAVWKPWDNGRIVGMLGVEQGLAVVDVTGDGVADTGEALTELGFTDSERERLATLYAPGSSFWRAPVPHFTAIDPNWPGFPSPGANPPQQRPPVASAPVPNPDCKPGSIIECQNQSLGESAMVVGTGFQLNYRSDRVPGRRTSHQLEIPLSGATVHESLQRIQLQVLVAGQSFTKDFPPLPNQKFTFEWNGLDGYGRRLQGQWPTKVRIGYVYPLVYQSPAEVRRSFARVSSAGTPISYNGAQRQFNFWQEHDTLLGEWSIPVKQLGGWTLDVHHMYEPRSQTLYLGTGERRTTGLTANQPIALTVAGDGEFGGTGDGGPATKAQLWNPHDVAAAPDGSLYIADTHNNRIRRVSPNGLISTVPGSEEYQPRYVAVGLDGSVYASHTDLHCIRRLRPDGTATAFAGQCGEQSGGDSGDEGPATQARLSYPHGIAMGRDGNLYIADHGNDRVRFVTPEGTIHTLAGKARARRYCGDGASALQACFSGPWGVAVGADGSVYVSDSANHRVRRITMDGRISTVAGTGADGSMGTNLGDGGPATKALLSSPKGLALDAAGNLYIADHLTRIRRVGTDGLITTFAGDPELYGYKGDGMQAPRTLFDTPVGLAVSPDGALYVSDEWNHRIRRVGYPARWMKENEAWVASESGSELYVFTPQGRHLRTVDALTQVVRYSFGYDAAGLLTSIQDENGLVTRIERDASGKPQAIVAPHGQRTRLEVGAHGYLSAIINPAEEKTALAYTTDGLLTELWDGRGGLHSFEYDTLGRLKKDANPAGGFQELVRTPLADGYTVSLSTALGRTTRYQVQNLPTGEEKRTTITPAGEVSITRRLPDGTTLYTAPDGTVTTEVQEPDPRLGMQSPLTSRTVKLPSGLTQTMNRGRATTFATPGDLFNVATVTDTMTVNGRTSTATYDAATRTLTTQSPLGRTFKTILDEKGRVVRQEMPGLLPVLYSYEGEGRLESSTQGTRTSRFTYNPQGYVETHQDAVSRFIRYTYGLAGRLATQTLPGNRTVEYGFDANGNLTVLTPPGQPTHTFTYTPADQQEDYLPPALAGVARVTTTQYNLDKQPTQVLYPDGAVLSFLYEDDATSKKGRRRAMILTPPTGGRYASRTRNASHYVGSGYLKSLSDSLGPSLSYLYDGALTTRDIWSGAIQGSIGYGYDPFFRISSVSVNDAPSISYGYDDDGLLAQAGALALSRNGANGLLEGTTLGQVSTVLGHNGHGEAELLEAFHGNTPLYSLNLVRDAAGRIQQKMEMVGEVTYVYTYTYDSAGWLQGVWEDDVLVSSAEYDGNAPGNGNRTALTQGLLTRSAAHDTQDRLLSYGDTTYTYGPNGDLQSKQVGSQKTTYVYDALGNLLSATLPDGTQVEYVIDASNRRVGKKVNGVLVQGFLYDSQSRIVAEFNGANQLVSRFVYATKTNVPDYMVKGGSTYRILTDHLGSPRLVVEANMGSIAQQMAHDAWGNVLVDTQPGFQPFGFAGGLQDRHTGLVRFGARDYDPETGRWTTKDPIRFAGGDSNLYVYVANDPVNLTDPSGLFVRKSPCANYSSAVALAMLWAGCKGGGTGAMSPNECQYQLAKNGGCNICVFLEDGIGPDLFLRPIPIGNGHTNVGNPDDVYWSFPGHPEPNSVLLDSGHCSGSADMLASKMIHEASHYCAAITGNPIPDGSSYTPGTGPYFENVCRKNKGGPCLP